MKICFISPSYSVDVVSVTLVATAALRRGLEKGGF